MRIAQRDRELIQIVDAAMAEAARKSGDWLKCRPGCASCCIGPFAITALDAIRLQEGLTELAATDPQRAERVRRRAQATADEIRRAFPNADITAVLDADFTDDHPCPALDPDTET